MINPIVSGVSSALQTLDQLLGSPPPSKPGFGAGATSAGQTLPGGAASTGAGSTPASQFEPAALGFLTSLQDEGSHIWGVAKGAIGHGLADVTSLVDELQQALNGSSSTASAQPSNLGSLATGAQSVLTSSAFAQALSELGTAAQDFAALGKQFRGQGTSAGPTTT